MSRLRSLTFPAVVHVCALLVGYIGFVVLVAAGAPEIPSVPPGAVLFLLVVAATIYWPRSRWPPLVGAVSCVVILVGAFLLYPGTLERLGDPASAVLFIGTFLQIVGVIVAAVSGAVATFARRPVARTAP